MSSSSKKNKTPKPVSERYTLTNAVANIFLFVAFVIFPLFVNLTFDAEFPFLHFDRGYYIIRHQKFYFFLVITAAAVIAELMLLVTRTSEAQKEKNPKKPNPLLQMTFTDWAVIAFVLSCAISTVFSAHIDMALNGEISIGGASHGRNNGLVLMLCYAALYFFLTRCWRYKEYVFTGLAVSSTIVSLLAVLNGFYIDPLNMFALFKDDTVVYNNFLTTIGNKNMFSTHLCVTLPVVMTMFVHTEKLWRKAVYCAATVIGAMAAVVCDSDSVVLGMGAFAAVFLVAYARRPQRLKQFMLILTVFTGSIWLLGRFAEWGGNHYKELSAIPYKLMTSDKTIIAVAVLAVLTLALFLLDFKFPNKTLPVAVPIALGTMFGLAALAGIGVVLYFSLIDTKTDLGDLERTLRFSDSWGTHRGFMWNKSMEAFGKYNFFQKLFGTGPDTFYYTFSPYFDELYDRFGDGSTDAAHNEYINYLMNIGIVGLTSYLAFTGSALVRAFKAAKREPVALVFASAVVAYMAQAVVNIALPIGTPLFIIFVSLCEAVARQKEREAV